MTNSLFKNLFICGKNRGGTFGISCFGISCIVACAPNNFRNFSATSLSLLCGKRMYNTYNKSNGSHFSDTLTLKDGTYSYLRNLKLPDTLKWDSGKSSIETLGPIGWFSDEKPLNEYGDFNANVKALQRILNSFSPLNSYSLSVMVVKRSEDFKSIISVKTIDFHYIVNNSTNALELMYHIYRQIEDSTIKYRFKVGDKIVCRFKPLYVKVKDPKFTGGRVDNTIYKPTSVKLNINSRFLSSSFLPHTMNLDFYGILLKKKGNVLYFLRSEDKWLIKLEIIETNLHHKIHVYDFKDSHLKLMVIVEDLRFEDTFIREFIKEDSSSTYVQYNLNFKLLNMEFEPKVTYLSSIKKDFKHNSNFITFDIEAYQVVNNNFIPYACGFYDGKKKYLYYTTDFVNPNEMLTQCFKDMLVPKYNNYVIYVHNLAKFDSSFIYRILEKNYKVSSIIPKDNGFMSFNVIHKINGKKIKVRFSDSLSLLPLSLYELGLSFNVETIKSIFPYSFVNVNNLKYRGPLPDIKYFKDNGNVDIILKYQDLWNWFKDKDWFMEDETKNYLNKDLVSLYQIMVKFDNIIFSQYRINITSHITIASLSISILRSNFLKDDKLLPKSKGELEDAIRSSYYGARNDVLKPKGHSLYGNDFNSLYPYAMLQDMPVGQPTFSLIKDLSKIFGIVKVKVTSPDNIYIPVLPCRTQTKYGDSKLIFPVSSFSFTGWYFSEEVKLAVKYGYKVEVIESYIYKRGKNVFKDYVLHMASIKDESQGAMRTIHKFLLNTPYGRLGMKNYRDVIKIVTKKEFEKLELRYKLIFYLELDKDKVLVKYNRHPDVIKFEQSGFDYEAELLKFMDSNIVLNSPVIASAITSWSRIIMYPFILNSYYTDTDSTFLNSPLSSSVVGKGLGKFKLEHGGIIKKAIFLSPKLYILDTIEGLKTKSKGFSGKLTMMDYIHLLEGGFIEVKDIRWRRHLELDTVQLIKQDYTIRAEFDKRNKLFSLGKWVDTSPLVINSSLEIENTSLVISKTRALIIYKPKPEFYIYYYLPEPFIKDYYLPKPKPELYIDYYLPETIIKDYYLLILDGSWINYKPLW